MGKAIGFYFSGLSKDEINEVRRKLNMLAAGLGYTAKGGPTKGQGNAAALLIAIAEGKIKLCQNVEQKPNVDESNK